MCVRTFWKIIAQLAQSWIPRSFAFFPGSLQTWSPKTINSHPSLGRSHPGWAGYLNPEAGPDPFLIKRAPASLESNGASERTLAHPSKHHEILTLRWPKGCHDLAGLLSQGIYLRNNNCDNLPEVGKLLVTNQNRWAPFERAIFEHDFQTVAIGLSGVRLSSPDVLDTTSLQQAFFGKMVHRNPMEKVHFFRLISYQKTMHTIHDKL